MARARAALLEAADGVQTTEQFFTTEGEGDTSDHTAPQVRFADRNSFAETVEMSLDDESNQHDSRPLSNTHILDKHALETIIEDSKESSRAGSKDSLLVQSLIHQVGPLGSIGQAEMQNDIEESKQTMNKLMASQIPIRDN